MRRLGRKIYIHEEVSDQLERDRRDVAPRFAMLCRHLSVNEWVRFKPTKGDNAGWRRSPLGGNNGSHYYMWWVAAGMGPGKQLDLGEGDIAIRSIRHHDLTDKRLPTGELDEYWEFQFVEEKKWIRDFINYKVGIDGVSLVFIILTSIIVPICIISTSNSVSVRIREFLISILLMETLMLGVFCSLDLVVFIVRIEKLFLTFFRLVKSPTIGSVCRGVSSYWI